MDRPYNAPSAAAPQRSYIARHWRGELSLARTFLLNGVALCLLFIVATSPLQALIFDASADPMTAGLIGLLIICAGLVLVTWQLVGLWRSARRQGGLVGVVVPLLIVAVLAHFAYPFAKGFVSGFSKSFSEQFERSSAD
ncbi:hypothetical protein KSS93_19260 [Pseudomonas xanthosomatis]|uniref:hypothetical protein n=1 Tax=Pseudomonas xanthosomatis TaxID=2842356 RepID=UPI001C3DBD22|nr:hypothetical protein [Pseudomonas xanthosomatis]QXH45011.1 hypothetical protein KSS93_19260 [Pseudomonas xanthosomatis]